MAALARQNLRLVRSGGADRDLSPRSLLPESAGPKVLDAARLHVRYDTLETELEAGGGIL